MRAAGARVLSSFAFFFPLSSFLFVFFVSHPAPSPRCPRSNDGAPTVHGRYSLSRENHSEGYYGVGVSAGDDETRLVASLLTRRVDVLLDDA